MTSRPAATAANGLPPPASNPMAGKGAGGNAATPPSNARRTDSDRRPYGAKPRKADMHKQHPTRAPFVTALRLDPTPDERGNVLAFAVMTNDRRIALTFNVN